MSNRLVILGAGESGVGAAILGQKKGWEVFVSDFGSIAEKYLNKLQELNIPFEQGGHDLARIEAADLIVKSPGIPNTAEVIKRTIAKGIKIESEIEFGFRYVGESKVIAITGTNGKTTTTSLIYHLLKNANFNVALAGNIGYSFAELVADNFYDYYVLEVSSFQLDDTDQFKPHIAVLLNITPDHLDRYEGDFNKYIHSKLRIADNMDGGDYFVYNADDESITKALRNNTTNNKPFTLTSSTRYSNRVEGDVLAVENKTNTFTMNISDLGLRGMHNTQNSMAAAIVGNVLDIRKETIRESLMNFDSIEHRLEFVAKVGGVNYINDSKATNVNSTWYALESIEKPIVWIAGGVDKGNDYELIRDLVKERVKLIVCLGKDNRKLHEAFAKDVDLIVNTSTAREAVLAASKFAEKEDTVLLSPACASFDLFESYEDRGQQFKEAVRNL